MLCLGICIQVVIENWFAYVRNESKYVVTDLAVNARHITGALCIFKFWPLLVRVFLDRVCFLSFFWFAYSRSFQIPGEEKYQLQLKIPVWIASISIATTSFTSSLEVQRTSSYPKESRVSRGSWLKQRKGADCVRIAYLLCKPIFLQNLPLRCSWIVWPNHEAPRQWTLFLSDWYRSVFCKV